jgi:hypothetical protein
VRLNTGRRLDRRRSVLHRHDVKTLRGSERRTPDVLLADDPRCPKASLQSGNGVVVGRGVVVVVVVVVGRAVVVVGRPVVVVVVVVVAGEAAACAGTITDLTTGFIQRSGKTNPLTAPTPSAVRKICRRSVLIALAPSQAILTILKPGSNPMQ